MKAPGRAAHERQTHKSEECFIIVIEAAWPSQAVPLFVLIAFFLFASMPIRFPSVS